MNAASKNDKTPKVASPMKGALITSSVFHVVVFVLAAVGIPFIASDPLVISPPINIEIVDIADISQTNRPEPPQKKAEEPKPPPPKQEAPKEMSAETPPDLLSPKPPEIEEVKEPAPPEPEPEPEPVKKEEEKPKPKPPPKPKKPDPKPVEPKQEDKFSSLLKNLTPDLDTSAEENDSPDPSQESGAPLSQIANLSDRLTISELDSFKQQISPCWNVPAGVKYAENLRVEIRVSMNRDATVREVSILDQGRYNRDSHFRAAAESARRALINPRCQPLRLPADKYDQWKTIVIGFDPRDML